LVVPPVTAAAVPTASPLSLSLSLPTLHFSLTDHCDNQLSCRLTPEAGKISLSKRTAEEELELFYWMGWELGNVHNGSKHAIENVKADLESRPKVKKFATLPWTVVPR
jgi:hypothetical protein